MLNKTAISNSVIDKHYAHHTCNSIESAIARPLINSMMNCAPSFEYLRNVLRDNAIHVSPTTYRYIMPTRVGDYSDIIYLHGLDGPNNIAQSLYQLALDVITLPVTVGGANTAEQIAINRSYICCAYVFFRTFAEDLDKKNTNMEERLIWDVQPFRRALYDGERDCPFEYQGRWLYALDEQHHTSSNAVVQHQTQQQIQHQTQQQIQHQTSSDEEFDDININTPYNFNAHQDDSQVVQQYEDGVDINKICYFNTYQNDSQVVQQYEDSVDINKICYFNTYQNDSQIVQQYEDDSL
ncbi:hypothetical protein Fsol_00600 [Candidatus Fokinia solitaria]|uniref:Uncharacterized protein n=1 Tax=Candidatus Fokinia solitaria TaxID=1802984 RepID=A0A2U8BSV0_9RICK|nr:hypothetical protein [Candidatus Fokinia solitaria]AWD33385.1 hypothetical protein Fsol_00600 [Candidatus Fokinia solitaria]